MRPMPSDPTSPIAQPPRGEPDWLEDGTPFSREFNDVYYSRDDGRAESQYVFLEHNALPSRWAALPDAPETLFVIHETGFGTGLNFLLAWQLWERVAPASARLVFRSLEGFALERMRSARWDMTGLEPFTRRFSPGRRCYPACTGVLRRVCSLPLATCEALAHGADTHRTRRKPTWFLDGFAPARNPTMWDGSDAARGCAQQARHHAGDLHRGAAMRAALAAHGSRSRAFPASGASATCCRRVRQPRRTAATDTPGTSHPPHGERRAIVIGTGSRAPLRPRAGAAAGA
jgi:tRNA 5-methylaminomethyl-2-thiouridine biosynthesis bifunctional protein